MSTFDFRILLETVDGGKTSYVSSSFVDTSAELVLSASQVFARITGSVSCSYQNTLFFSQSAEPTTNDINTSFVFKDNNLLSASLTGSLDTGAIEFTSLNTEYNRLLRYKFYGEKVCSTLGLPNNQWVYVDQMRLPADNEANYFEGNVNAKSMYVSDNLSFSNQSTVDSDIPFNIDTGSDRHIKFIDNSGLPTPGLYMGYDKENNIYEIGGEKGNFEIHSGSLVEAAEISKLFIISSSNPAGTIDMRTAGINIQAASATEDPAIELQNPDRSKVFKTEIVGTGTGRISMVGGTGDIEIRTQNFADAIFIDNSEDSVGIGTDDPEATLHVAGDIKADGTGSFGRVETTIVSSSIMFSSGSNIFGDAIDDSHTFNGHITASGNISASGNINTSGSVTNRVQAVDGTGLQLFEDGGSGIFIKDGGRVGIGTTNPGGQLEVTTTSIRAAEFTSDNDAPILVESTDGTTGITFKDNSAEQQIYYRGNKNAFYIENPTKLGLGTNDPLETLDVRGSASFSGHITASGNISGSATSTLQTGNVLAKTFKSEKIFTFLTSASDGDKYYFPIGAHYLQTSAGAAVTIPSSAYVQTAMCDLSIKRLKIQFIFGTLTVGTSFKMYCRKYDGSGDIDNDTNFTDVGTAWTVTTSNIAVNARFFHAPSDWDISAGDIWGIQYQLNGNDGLVWFNGGLAIEEDWNTLISS